MKYEIGSEESVSEAVITSVIMSENTCIENLPELYEALEPEALDVLFRRDGRNGRVSFSYSNSFVDIYSGKYLIVETLPD